MRMLAKSLAVVALAVAPCCADRAQAGDTGTVTGQFVLDGEIPKLAPLV